MKIHHLNCASFCPANILKSNIYTKKIPSIKLPTLGKKLLQKIPMDVNKLSSKANINLEIETNAINQLQTMITHCMLIETKDRLILVDTGIGHQFIKKNQGKLTTQKVTELFLGAKLDLQETAKYQIEKLGFSSSDVTDVIISHFDFDHISGLQDFPQATAHTFKNEYMFSSNSQLSFAEKNRFLKELWKDHQHWNLLGMPQQTYQNLKVVNFPGEEDLLLALLPGHTPFQLGVIIPKFNLIFAADSYIHHSQINHYPYTAMPVKIYQKMTTVDKKSYQETLEKLVHLKGQGHHVFCAHDNQEFIKIND